MRLAEGFPECSETGCLLSKSSTGDNYIRREDKGLRNSKGFSLLEVMIGLLILAIGLLGLAGMMTMTIKGNAFGSHLTEASTFAEAKLEEFRSIHPVVGTGSDAVVSSTGVGFTRSQVVVRQGSAYTAQEQVVDVQQSVGLAMDHMVRDILKAAYDSDSSTSRISIPDPVTTGSSQLSLSYEYDDTTEYTVTYRLNGGQLVRQLTATRDTGVSNSIEEIVLEGVESLDFSYGLDIDNDGVVNSWVPASGVTSKVIAIRVRLSARALSSDLKDVSTRGLESMVILRNRIL